MSHRRGSTGPHLSWTRANFMGLQTVNLVAAVSRYAKDSTLPYGLRAQLYSVKAAGILALFQQGKLLPEHVSPGCWVFARALRLSISARTDVSTEAVDALLDQAERTATALDPQKLLNCGIHLTDLPLPNLNARSSLTSLSASQTSRFDPRGSWLIGFCTPGSSTGENWCDLHQPYRLVASWTDVTNLNMTSTDRLEPGAYGRPPDRAFRTEHPLGEILAALHVTGLNRKKRQTTSPLRTDN